MAAAQVVETLVIVSNSPIQDSGTHLHDHLCYLLIKLHYI